MVFSVFVFVPEPLIKSVVSGGSFVCPFSSFTLDFNEAEVECETPSSLSVTSGENPRAGLLKLSALFN